MASGFVVSNKAYASVLALVRAELRGFFIQVGYSADFGSRMQLAVQTFLTLQVAVFVGSWSSRPVRVRRAFAVVSLLCFVSTGWEIGRRVHHGLTVPRNEWRVMQLPNVFVENRCTANFTADASRWHLGPNDVSSPRLDDFSAAILSAVFIAATTTGSRWKKITKDIKHI